MDRRERRPANETDQNPRKSDLIRKNLKLKIDKRTCNQSRTEIRLHRKEEGLMKYACRLSIELADRGVNHDPTGQKFHRRIPERDPFGTVAALSPEEKPA